MYRKFIGITMQHLTNKYIISIFMAVFLMPCSHIAHFVYDEDQILEDSDKDVYSEVNPPPKKTKYEEIYCTPEDEKKRVKTTKITIDSLNVPCGLAKIQPIENRTLEIKRIFLGAERLPTGDILLGHHLLLLKASDKILQEIKIEKEDDPFWRHVVFVKIRKDAYWQDINNDGYPEFAILPTEMGNAIYRPAYIYTLKNNSFYFYGKGKYIWYTGQHVLLNCPKCWEYDLNECKKCT